MKPLQQHNILSEQAARDAELESLLHSLGAEIERQRNTIRALCYASISTFIFVFFLGAAVGSAFG